MAVNGPALFPSHATPASAASVDAFSLVSDDLAAMTREIHAELEVRGNKCRVGLSGVKELFTYERYHI